MQNEDKVKKRIKQIYDKCDTGMLNVNFKEHIEKKILGYQTWHILALRKVLKDNNAACALDCSATGTGKTYTTLALCGQMNWEPIIICPKSVICYWKEICDYFQVKPKTIINYESIKKGKELDDDMEKKKSDMVSFEDDKFTWKNVDRNKNIIIFDEAHRCKNYKSQNGRLLLSAKNICRILLLSATIAQKPEDFLIFGYMLGFYNNTKSGKKWIESTTRKDIFRLETDGESELEKFIYANKGSRMSLSDMAKSANKNNISAQCFSLDEKYLKEIAACYREIKIKGSQLLDQSAARQKIEMAKVPIFIELIEKYYELGKSIVVFVNFLNPFNTLKKYFNKKFDFSCIMGSQTLEERRENIERFQKNETRLMICTLTAGSESVSLHDTDGSYPRVSLISPSFSGKDLCQALGRIYRTGVKSQIEQKIIFCDEPTEISICNTLREKIRFLNNFADYDKFDSSILDINF
jgi:superfamily II DNA or RNA helicase